MLARYILRDGPVLVHPSVWLGAEGLRDAKSCRGTRVATLSCPCGLLLQTRSCGVVGPSMWPIAIGAIVEQPDGQRIGHFSFIIICQMSPPASSGVRSGLLEDLDRGCEKGL